MREYLYWGGDIYIKKDNYFYQIYDNWYYEGSNLFNSIDKAMHYLSQIKLENAYVSFVLKYLTKEAQE